MAFFEEFRINQVCFSIEQTTHQVAVFKASGNTPCANFIRNIKQKPDGSYDNDLRREANKKRDNSSMVYL